MGNTWFTKDYYDETLTTFLLVAMIFPVQHQIFLKKIYRNFHLVQRRSGLAIVTRLSIADNGLLHLL